MKDTEIITRFIDLGRIDPIGWWIAEFLFGIYHRFPLGIVFIMEALYHG